MFWVIFASLALLANAKPAPQQTLEDRFPIQQLGERLRVSQPVEQPQPVFTVFQPVAIQEPEEEVPVTTTAESSVFVLGEDTALPSAVQPISSQPEPVPAPAPIFDTFEVPTAPVFIPISSAPAPRVTQFQRQGFVDERSAVINSEDRLEPDAAGNSGFRYETSNGISHVERSYTADDGSRVVTGSYKYISPEGEEIEVYYEADRNGFRVQTDDLPVGPPMPEHSRQQFLRGQQLHREAAERRRLAARQ